jgi:hypothetical protein
MKKGKQIMNDFLKEKWIADGCQISEPYDYTAEDMERQHEAVLALERTLDEMLSR